MGFSHSIHFSFHMAILDSFSRLHMENGRSNKARYRPLGLAKLSRKEWPFRFQSGAQ